MVCKECGKENSIDAIFCAKCGTKIKEDNEATTKEISKVEEVNKTNEENSETSNKGEVQVDNKIEVNGVNTVNNKTMKVDSIKLLAKKLWDDNKKRKDLILAISAVGIILLGIISYNIFGSNDMSEKVIRENLMDSVVKYNNINCKITEENLKSVDITVSNPDEKNNIKTCFTKGNLIIEDSKCKLEIPYSAMYIYNKQSKKWEVDKNGNNIIEEEIKCEIKELPTEENIKKSFIDQELYGKLMLGKVEITEEIANNSNVKIKNDEKDSTKVKVEGELTAKESFISRNFKFKCDAKFDGSRWKTEISPQSLEEIIKVDEPKEDIKTDEVKANISMLSKGEGLIFTKYKGGLASIEIKDITNVEDLKIYKIGYDEGYTIKANVSAKRGVMTVKGELVIEVDKERVSWEMHDDEVSVEKPSKEQVEKLLEKQGIDTYSDNATLGYTTHKLTEEEVKSFKFDEVIDSTSEPLTKHAYGYITYSVEDDKHENVLSYIKLVYNEKEKSWGVNKFVSSKRPNFEMNFKKEKFK